MPITRRNITRDQVPLTLNARGRHGPLSLASHAKLDLLAVLVMLLAPRALKLGRATSRVSALLGLSGLLTALVTDYPTPLPHAPLLSASTHGRLELLTAPAYAATAYRVAGRDRGYLLALLGAFLITHALTEWEGRTQE